MIIPKGFQYNAFLRFPLNKAVTDLVEPQAGHGYPDICLTKQTPTTSDSDAVVFDWLINIHR